MIGFVDLQLGKTFLFLMQTSIASARVAGKPTNQGRRKTLVQPEGNRAKLYRVTYLVSPPRRRPSYVVLLPKPELPPARRWTSLLQVSSGTNTIY